MDGPQGLDVRFLGAGERRARRRRRPRDGRGDEPARCRLALDGDDDDTDEDEQDGRDHDELTTGHLRGARLRLQHHCLARAPAVRTGPYAIPRQIRCQSVVNANVTIGLTYLDIACAARSIPSHPPRSVYQTLLARSTAIPNGRASGRGRRNSVTWPSRSRPSRPLRSSVTQTAPSGATASAVSPGDGVGITNSVNRLSAKRPILPACCSRNHTAPMASTATSPSPLPRVGTSNSVIWPSPAMRASRFASGNVAQTVPCGSTATPQGAAPAERDTWRVNTPSLSRVTLA